MGQRLVNLEWHGIILLDLNGDVANLTLKCGRLA